MIDGGEKRNCQLAFGLQNSHVCEKRSNVIFAINCGGCKDASLSKRYKTSSQAYFSKPN